MPIGIKFPDIVVLERKLYAKLRGISPNDFVFKLTGISLALLCRGKPMGRLGLLLWAGAG